ncbi:MAG: hypothetical protein ABW153_06850 [Sedimenticola sp.]
MLPNSSFTDLRLNRQDGQNQESFWPSFTDIMTVIVMIFMIAMVILLLRNIELVNQLRATMAAERSAMELARTTGEEKESLALKLIDTENKLSMLQIKMMRLEEMSQQQDVTIGNQDVEISRLIAEKEDLTLHRDQLAAENYTLGQKLKRSQTQINTLQQNYNTIQQNYNITQQQLTESQQLLAETQTALTGMKAQVEAIQQQLASLQDRYTTQSEELQQEKTTGRQTILELSSLRGEYRELKIKYDRLVRPARSPEGRYLVEVRYSKVDGQFLIDAKTQDEAGFSRISQQVLEQKLSQLKAVQSDGLYIKVIFPENSGLSFNEAWSFTNNLHNSFDYYYQDDAPGMIPLPAEISQ